MNGAPHARLGVLAAILLALLPAALALWIHDGRGTSTGAALAAAAPSSASTPIPAAPPQRVVESPKRIAADVEALRGLRFAKLPPVEIIGPAQAAQMQKKQAAKIKLKLTGRSDKLKKLRRESEASLEFLKLAGVVDPDFNIQQTVEALLGSVAGEFDPSSRKVKVLETLGEGPEQRATVIAHELDHSLDNEHYGQVFKTSSNRSESERQLAASALIEGTATLVAARFDRRHGYQAAVAGGALLSTQNAGYGVPPVLAAQFRFPYTSGARFVRTLYRRADGWRLVNRAFEHPPTTTGQILNPELWIHHVGYARFRLDTQLGRPLPLVEQTTSGQLDAELILALALPADVARSASRGWDGGSIALWQAPGSAGCKSPCRSADVAALADRWRSVRAAARFLAQLPAYLRIRLGARAAGPGLFRVGDGFAAVALQRNGTAMSFAPTPAQAKRIANGAAKEATAAR